MKNIIASTLVVGMLMVMPIMASAQLKCYSLRAPEKTIEGMTKLALMNFENRKDINWNYYSSVNDYGSQLVDYMTAKLLEEHRGVYSNEDNYMQRYKTDVYTVVERGELDKIMAEQSLGASGAVSDGDAASVGKLLGVDVIISGGYTTAVSSKSSVSSNKDSKTGKISHIYKATKESKVEVTMKIISVETGEILSLTTKTKNLKRKSLSTKTMAEAKGGLESDESLITETMKAISFDLVSYFTPTFSFQSLDFEKPKVKAYKEQYKKAKNMVKSKDLSSAYAIVKEVYEADPYDAAMAHNIAVLNEAVGNFDEAISFHEIAYQINDSKGHKADVDRAKNSKNALEELSKLGIEATPYAFDETVGAKLTAEKVTTAGKTKDRINAYAESNKGSDIVAKVPGDTSFEVLEREGSFVKVKLLGGKEGWISTLELDN